MGRIGVTALFLLVMGSLPVGRAQGPDKALTMEEAVTLALSRNPEMLVALAEQEELKGKIKEVRSGAFPQATFQGSGLRMRDPSILNSSSFDKVPKDFKDALVPTASNMFDMELDVKQPVYSAGKVSTALKLAKESLGEKAAISESVRQQLAFKVFQAFKNLFLMQANLEVVQETRQQRIKHLEQAKIRFNSGVATEIDVLRSEVNVANMEPDVIRAVNSVRLARAAINDLIMEDLDAPTKVAGSLEYRPWDPGSIDDIQKRTLEQRPELQAARSEVQQARFTTSLANAENKLTVDMEGQYGYAVRQLQNMFNPDYSRWNVTFSFKLPLLDSGRKAGLVMQAQAQLRAAEQRLARLENECRLEVKQAYDSMQSSAKAIEAAQLSVRQAEKVLTLMQANYQYGAATTLDVTDSQTALSEARNSQISATYQYEMAKARLRLASGSPILDKEVDR
ncbi:MAG TPA: TolC family protein [Acidobacteriota bacterium]|nr:TolC family protein [Acidobacteriota bacterium]